MAQTINPNTPLNLFKSRTRLVQESLVFTTLHHKKRPEPTRMEKRIKHALHLLRELLPWLLFVMYSVLGATTVYQIELKFPMKIYPELGHLESQCLVTRGWWGALYYVSTLYTTIGKFKRPLRGN